MLSKQDYARQMLDLQYLPTLPKERKRLNRGETKFEADIWDEVIQQIYGSSSPPSSGPSSRRDSFSPVIIDKGPNDHLDESEQFKAHAEEPLRYGRQFHSQLARMKCTTRFNNVIYLSSQSRRAEKPEVIRRLVDVNGARLRFRHLRRQPSIEYGRNKLCSKCVGNSLRVRAAYLQHHRRSTLRSAIIVELNGQECAKIVLIAIALLP